MLSTIGFFVNAPLTDANSIYIESAFDKGDDDYKSGKLFASDHANTPDWTHLKKFFRAPKGDKKKSSLRYPMYLEVLVNSDGPVI